ncbi:MAG: GNAT family N-acetyltransferase [Gorillibacterium sp.]|nr:GNAT family N-acetyltransferase [Gorillibacterium sp.]
MKISGARVTLRFLEETDLPAVMKFQLQNKELFAKYSPRRDADYYTEAGQIERIRKNRADAEAEIGCSCGIFLNETQELVGSVGLSHMDMHMMQTCMIGYNMDQNYHGHGYMTEAVQLLIDHAFRELKLHRITAEAMPHNLGSIRVLEKAGFQREGIARKNVKINGKFEDHVVLAILNPYETE